MPHSCRRRFPGERGGRYPGDRHIRDKERPGQRMLTQLAIIQTPSRRRDDERSVGEERAARGLRDRHRDRLDDLAFWRVAAHLVSAPQRHPDTSVDVDAQAIRQPFALGNVNERAQLAYRAVISVEIGSHDAALVAVGNDHRAVVGGPADSVRQGEPARHSRAGRARLPAVQLTGAVARSPHHAARPQSAAAVDGGIIHAVLGLGQRLVDQREHSMVDDTESIVDRGSVSGVLRARRDGAQRSADHGLLRRARRHLGRVEHAFGEVDPHQSTVPVVDDRAFADGRFGSHQQVRGSTFPRHLASMPRTVLRASRLSHPHSHVRKRFV